MKVLDVYYMNDLYYMVIEVQDSKVRTYNQLGEYDVFDFEELNTASYKGNLLKESRLIRLVR